MYLNDLILLSPVLALIVTALLVILADLVVSDKKTVAALAVVGILTAAGLATWLWLTGQTGEAFSGMYVFDAFSFAFMLLFLGIGALIIVASADYASRFHDSEGEYYALLLASLSGMLLMASSRELVSIYIALELTSIPLYALAAWSKDARSAEAGLKYLLLGAISSAVLLYGMALTYGVTGSTNLIAIAQAAPVAGAPNYAVLLLAIVFMIAGFGFKIAAFPFQMWVPDVYEGAPTPVTAFLSVASKAAGFAVILRVFYEAFPGQAQDWSILWAIIAAFSMTLGNVVATAQNNIKRMLGYSSIAQAGYLLIGVASVNVAGPTSVIFYLFTYAFTNILAFTAIITISNKLGTDQIDDYKGMRTRSPWMAAALAFAMISLTGLPPAAGFFAKIYVFQAAIDANLTWLVLIGVLNTVISAYYYLRVVKVMYVDPVPEGEAGQNVATTVAQFTAAALAGIGVLSLFVLPALLLGLAQNGATALFG